MLMVHTCVYNQSSKTQPKWLLKRASIINQWGQREQGEYNNSNILEGKSRCNWYKPAESTDTYVDSVGSPEARWLVQRSPTVSVRIFKTWYFQKEKAGGTPEKAVWPVFLPDLLSLPICLANSLSHNPSRGLKISLLGEVEPHSL